MAKLFRTAAAALLAVLPAALAAQDAPPQTVTVVTLQPQSIMMTSTLPGRVRASAEAEVRPQVNGIVVERLFEEGSAVEAGDVLYRIDPANYQAAVDQANASVNQAEAQLRGAEREAERVQTLSQRGINSAATEDDALSARDAAAAGLQVARAQLTTAEIELDRTDVRARLDGQIGFSDVSEGTLVTASQATPLTIIRALDPVHVDVTQSAADLIAWRRQGDEAVRDREVSLTLADGSEYGITGRLSAAEPHVDEQTGVVVLRMTFDNPDGMLLPGMYVQVEMPTGTRNDVFLAPQEGVSRDRRGDPTGLVVNAEGVVEERALRILQDLGSDWVISDGLNPGDRLIVEGLQKIQPGANVQAEEREGEGQAEQTASDGKGRDVAAAAESPADGSDAPSRKD